jgi:plastocyanin
MNDLALIASTTRAAGPVATRFDDVSIGLHRATAILVAGMFASDKHTFKSKILDGDERFSFTFTKPGEYSYFCSLHPHMVGKVVVKAG